MKRLLLILILTLSFQSWTKADDIRDFQIEGISIGDSLLDHLSKEEILNEITSNAFMYKAFIPKDKFGEVYIFKKTDNYDQMSFFVKAEDPKYEIYMIRGMINFNNELDKCLEKKIEIVKDVEAAFSDFEKTNNKFKSDLDPTGRSYYYQTKFQFNDDSGLNIMCSDWEESLRKKQNWSEGITVAIQAKEFFEWITSND